MLLFFIVVCTLMIITDFYLNRKIINVVSCFTAPYLVIAAGNHFFGERNGFYRIDDRVLGMLWVGLFSIYAGSLLVSIRNRRVIKYLDFSLNNVERYIKNYKIGGMSIYVLLVEILLASRFIHILQTYGINAIISEGGIELIGGLIGHIFLSAYPLIPILVLYWLYHKKNIKIFLIILIYFALLACSFVKYHVIAMLILTYLFVSFEDKKYVKRGAIMMVSFIVVLFVGNYVADFFLTNRLGSINSQFYVNHLWKYIAGSVIHDNLIFTDGVNPGQGVFIKVIYCLSSLVNMFYYGLTGLSFKWPFHIDMDVIAYNGEATNVVDFIGFMYPSRGNMISVAGFVFIMLFIGFIYQYIYDYSLKNKRGFVMPLYIMMTFFMFLSFFGNYYALSVPWEILVWSLITPTLFNNKARIRINFGRSAGRV